MQIETPDTVKAGELESEKGDASRNLQVTEQQLFQSPFCLDFFHERQRRLRHAWEKDSKRPWTLANIAHYYEQHWPMSGFKGIDADVPTFGSDDVTAAQPDRQVARGMGRGAACGN